MGTSSRLAFTYHSHYRRLFSHVSHSFQANQLVKENREKFDQANKDVHEYRQKQEGNYRLALKLTAFLRRTFT